eukprot:gene43267-53710_t
MHLALRGGLQKAFHLRSVVVACGRSRRYGLQPRGVVRQVRSPAPTQPAWRGLRHSGPNNRMFYFLSQGSNATSSSDYYSSYLNKQPLAMTGVGNDKAYRIWFKALTTKFTSSTNYADARTKMITAAEELYGVGSKEATAVKRAYAAINVGLDVDEVAGGGGKQRFAVGQQEAFVEAIFD